MVTIILYILLPILCLFGITYMLSNLIVLVIMFVLRTPIFASMISGGITWIIISLLWRYFDGRPMPILAYLIGAIALFIYGTINREKLNEGAKMILVFEIVGIIILAIIVSIEATQVRFI